MISRECIEKIRDRVDICDVVSPYVILKRCGANLRGLSPFNHEKTPSFFVMPAKKIFHCFSSGNAGDIFRFIELVEHVPFGDAVEMIADRFNIALEFEKTGTGDSRSYSKKSLFELHELACDFFVKNFHAVDKFGEMLRNYWVNGRKFPLEVAVENGIGFAANRGDVLIRRMLDAGFSSEAIKNSGIFYLRENESDVHRAVLRFRMRLTIPIRDLQGRIVGFSARFVDGITPNNELADAKYINSPETEIFHKGNLLFGLHRARQHISNGDAFWMVEGQFDAMRCWMNGLGTAIAPQGTAITDAQLATLRRYSPRLNCMLDGDSAGLKAAERMLPLAIAAGLNVKFFPLPDGMDPDEYFRQDFSDRLEVLLRSEMDAIQFLLGRFLPAGSGASAHEKAEALSKIYEIIAVADSSVVREGYLEDLALAANLDRSSVLQDFKSFSTKRKFTSAPPVRLAEERRKKLSTAEGQLLAIVLCNKKIGAEVANFAGEDFLQNLSSDEGKVLQKVTNEIKECTWDGIGTLDDSRLFSADEKNLAYALLAGLDDDLEAVQLANACIKKIYVDSVKGAIRAIDETFRKISLDESEVIKTLQQRRLSLRKKLGCPPQIS
jgi:DNA primase